MVESISLCLASSEDAGALQELGRAGTSRILGGREARRREVATADLPPKLVILLDGKPAGLVRFAHAVHPSGWAGHVVEMAIEGNARLQTELSSCLAAIESAVHALSSVDTIVTAADGGEGPARDILRQSGYEKTPAGTFVRELTGAFWRQGRVFVIAEAGSNWRMGTRARDLEMARRLIDVAKEAGADAVKYQTFRPETIYAHNAGSSDYLSEAGIKQDMNEIFSDLAMPYEMIGVLAEYAQRAGIQFMSTAFSAADFAAVDPHVSIHKIASYEISHPRLIELAARSGKPTLISTGAATVEDIDWATDYFFATGGRDLCLLQCTAKYPAPAETLNLQAIPWLRRRSGLPTGLSDHSREALVAPVVAVGLGARVIEKHFTIDNRLPGPDHAFAVTPLELSGMVAAVRTAEAALGPGGKGVHDQEEELALFAQRALQATTPIEVGDLLSEDRNIGILRPGKQQKGLHPRHLARIEGKRALRALEAGQGLREGDWVD